MSTIYRVAIILILAIFLILVIIPILAVFLLITVIRRIPQVKFPLFDLIKKYVE